MAGGIPTEAVGPSVVVLLYSSICFTLCALLVCLLWSFGERWTFVTIFSTFTAISTLASIIQQIHYATSWLVIKQAQFKQAVKSLTHPGLAFGGAAEQTDIILFYIQFYCYNTMALNVLFWAVALFVGAWGFRLNWLGDVQSKIGPASKVFTIVFPALIVGLMQVEAIIDSAAGFFILSNITFLISMSAGTILLILILYKYMKTRRLVMGSSRRGGWWASGGSKDRRQRDIGTEGTIESEYTASTGRSSIYDRALVARFTIGFVILAIFEAAIIIFNVFQSGNNASIAASGGPNLTVGNAVIDICLFIPGVTASLVAFLVFGTTKSWRQYRDLIIGGCGLRSRILLERRQREEDTNAEGLEFQRLPSLQSQPEDEEAARGKDLENRVRMFARESQATSASHDASGPSNPTRDIPPTRIQNFHRPFPSLDRSTKSSKGATSGVIEVGLSIDVEDQVIQYEQEPEIVSQERPRRFVRDRLPHQQDFLEDSSD